jgi:GT2 family glycosyltransferase
MMGDTRVSVVVLTHNRAYELERTLCSLFRLPEAPAVIVADNASGADTAEVMRRFPQATHVRLPCNRGAAGRNAGVEHVRTPYVAFCDDDTWWASGALSCAADLLDAHPRLAAVAARVLVGAHEQLDPACLRMARSPLAAEGLPGPALIAFMAGAAVMRVSAYRSVGGYEPRFFIGAEEPLMGLDLATQGWQMMYAADVVVHHHPSRTRDVLARRVLEGRNRLWLAWLRLPWRMAWRDSRILLRDLSGQGVAGAAVRAALRGLPWVLARRQVASVEALAMREQVFGGCKAPTQRGRSPR